MGLFSALSMAGPAVVGHCCGIFFVDERRLNQIHLSGPSLRRDSILCPVLEVDILDSGDRLRCEPGGHHLVSDHVTGTG